MSNKEQNTLAEACH